MFTGIVESIGCIEQIDRSDAVTDFCISTGSINPKSVNVGDSVSISGVCLTVVRIDDEAICVQISNETISRTNFSQFEAGTKVNLERSLTLEKPLGGHLVSGHVDGTGQCVEINADGSSRCIEFVVDSNDLGKFLAEKGSVAVDGVSMTVNSVTDQADSTRFEVNVIPHTLSATTLGSLKVGDLVHIEIDTVARYLDRLMEFYRLSIGTKE